MKKILATLLAVSMTAGIVNAQQVLSRNAVGYVKVDIESNKLYFVGVPFINMADGSDMHRITNVFAGLPPLSIVSIWNPVDQVFDSFGRNSRGTWGTAAETAEISRLQGAFLRLPADNPPTNIFLMGEVPDSTTAPTQAMERFSGLTAVIYPYPAQVRMTNTALGINLPALGIISIWDSGTQEYISVGKSSRGVWGSDADTLDLLPGQAVFLRTSVAGTWDEVKPYTWP